MFLKPQAAFPEDCSQKRHVIVTNNGPEELPLLLEHGQHMEVMRVSVLTGLCSVTALQLSYPVSEH